MRFKKNKVIKTSLGQYERALETLTNIFYVNFTESDENHSVIMFDRKLNKISDNYFAYEAMTEVIAKKEYSWISSKLANQIKDKDIEFN